MISLTPFKIIISSTLKNLIFGNGYELKVNIGGGGKTVYVVVCRKKVAVGGVTPPNTSPPLFTPADQWIFHLKTT
jgi:hypothetical protein